MESRRDYHHQPLGSADSFRVFDLLPAKSKDDPVVIRIREVMLPLIEGDYEALSYVWGAAPGHKIIFCDDLGHGCIEVTQNCFLALIHLRLPSGVRTLWVDSICIDQRQNAVSDQERKHQIQRMGDIYQSAHRVIIWLTFREYGYKQLFQLLRELSRRHRLEQKGLVKVSQVVGACFKGKVKLS